MCGAVRYASPLTHTLALSLLVLRIFADDHNAAVAANDLALLAHWFDRRSYFHCYDHSFPFRELFLPRNREKLRFAFDFLRCVYLLRHVILPRVKSYGDI